MSLPIAVLASGRGSNLQAILNAIGNGSLDAQVVLVLSDKANAKALERAKNEGIPAYHVDPKAFGCLLYTSCQPVTLEVVGSNPICVVSFLPR